MTWKFPKKISSNIPFYPNSYLTSLARYFSFFGKESDKNCFVSRAFNALKQALISLEYYHTNLSNIYLYFSSSYLLYLFWLG